MNAAANKILLTRPVQRSRELAAMLGERGFQPILCPVIEIVQLMDAEELRAAWTHWRESVEQGLVVLTSVHTVEFLVEARVNVDLPCAVVGPRTKQAVRGAGWQVQPVDAKDGRSLAEGLIKAGYVTAAVWLPCSKKAGTELEDSLRAAGSDVTRVEVYEPRPVTEQLLLVAGDAQAFDMIVFHSSSAVDAVVDAIGAERLANVEVVCVGESTASRAEHRGLREVSVAQQPSDEAVRDALVELGVSS